MVNATIGTANWTQEYSYDRYGNKTGVTKTGVDLYNNSVPADGLPSVSVDPATNRMTTASGWLYDLAGNLIRGQNASGVWQRFEYDAAGRLVKIRDDFTNLIETYTYGATRERLMTETTAGRTYYVWGGQSVIAEYAETGSGTIPTFSKSYVYAGSRLLMISYSSGSAEFHHPDRIGTQFVTYGGTLNGGRQSTYPFGTLEQGPLSNQVFTSYDRSTNTGLDYAVNRTYSSGQSRFTQVDPIGMAAASIGNPQSNNLYAYVQNMPTDFVDPSGLNLSNPFIGNFSVTVSISWFERMWDNYWGADNGFTGGDTGRRGPPDLDPGGGGGGGGGRGDCNLAQIFGDPGSYFFDDTKGELDKVLGRRAGTSTNHSHLYGSSTDATVSTDVYFPRGGQLVQPNNRVPGSKFLGASYDVSDGKRYYNANYVLIQFKHLNVTLAIFHIDDFQQTLQADGRTKIGNIGFSGSENYGSGGSIKNKGGHSHFEVIKGLRWNLAGKRTNFDLFCR